MQRYSHDGPLTKPKSQAQILIKRLNLANILNLQKTLSFLGSHLIEYIPKPPTLKQIQQIPFLCSSAQNTPFSSCCAFLENVCSDTCKCLKHNECLREGLLTASSFCFNVCVTKYIIFCFCFLFFLHIKCLRVLNTKSGWVISITACFHPLEMPILLPVGLGLTACSCVGFVSYITHDDLKGPWWILN